MFIALSIAGGVLLLVVAISLFSKMVLASIRKPLMARAAKRYPGNTPETTMLASEWGANSFGLTSLGRFQARGNGALVLTPKELCFFQYLPERDFVIPLSQVTETSFVHSHLGKATPYKLLKIAFKQEAGDDSIAILLRDPQTFVKQLEALR